MSIKSLLKKFANFFTKHFYNIISIQILIILFISLLINLINDYNTFILILEEVRKDVITISGLFSGLIIAYLTARVIQVRQEKLAKLPILDKTTQDLHRIRSIIDKLLHSDIWPEDTKIFVDTDFKDLTHFRVEEAEFIGSLPDQKVKNFIEDKRYGGIASLYLDLKSFVSTKHPFDLTVVSEFEVPVYYSPTIVNKWVNYNSGNSLWYSFQNKWSSYSQRIDLNNINNIDKEEILKTCLKIDKERYNNMEFTAELLGKIGTQLTAEILPKLQRAQIYMSSDLPQIIKILYFMSGLILIFGVVIPLANKIFLISPVLDILSIAVVFSLCFHFIISFYDVMIRESSVVEYSMMKNK